jgi:hypothetical protein
MWIYLLKQVGNVTFYGSSCTKNAKSNLDSLILITPRGKNNHVKFWRAMCFYHMIENKTAFMHLSLPLRRALSLNK